MSVTSPEGRHQERPLRHSLRRLELLLQRRHPFLPLHVRRRTLRRPPQPETRQRQFAVRRGNLKECLFGRGVVGVVELPRTERVEQARQQLEMELSQELFES